MKNRIKHLLKKGTELWQSGNQKYKNMKIGGMLFSIFGAICLFLSYILMNESLIITSIAKYTFRYFALFMFCVAINFFVIYFYVYNNIKIFKSYAKYFLIPLIMLSVVTLIVGIPFTILSGVIAKILGFRAKKMDNLMSFIFYLLITIIVIGVFIYPNYILAYSISKFLENLLTIKYNLNLGVYSMGLFIFISLLKLEVDAFYRGLLFIKQRKQSKSINKILKMRVNVLDKNISYSNFDIKNHIQKKSDTLKIEEDKLKDEISYDITYLKNTLRKVQLAILILFFVVIVLEIMPKELLRDFETYKSDTINVLTIYTLIMLYLDKRKEWK